MSLALKEVIRIGEQMLADAGVADAAIEALQSVTSFEASCSSTAAFVSSCSSAASSTGSISSSLMAFLLKRRGSKQTKQPGAGCPGHYSL